MPMNKKRQNQLRRNKQQREEKESNARECGICYEPIQTSGMKWEAQSMRCCGQDICSDCIMQVMRMALGNDSSHFSISVKCPFCREIEPLSYGEKDLEIGGDSILKQMLADVKGHAYIIPCGCNGIRCDERLVLTHTRCEGGSGCFDCTMSEIIHIFI
jgi:hypothetical protein